MNIKIFLNSHLFKPSFIGLVVNPFFIARSCLHFNIKKLAPLFTGNLLDIGCGDKPYELLFNNVEKYEGIEIDTTVHESTKAEYIYDGKTLPFLENSYQSVILNEVIEHVFNPDELLREIKRIIKIDGKLMITLPFVWDEHEQPYDYARYSSFGIKYLLEKNGFTVQKISKSCPNISVLFQLLNLYIYKTTKSLPLVIRFFITIICCFPINIIGLILGFILPNNNDLYLDNVIIATKA